MRRPGFNVGKEYTMTSQVVILFGAVFAASCVESVEAAVITMAAASEKGWRPALWGAGSAIALMALFVVCGGIPLAKLVPIQILQCVMGAGMLWIGWRWWVKATQRLAGVRAIKTEQQRYQDTVTEMRSRSRTGFLVAFQGTALEMFEVVLIAVTLGTASRDLGVAGLAAVVAVVLIIGLAVISRKQLNRLPEVLTKTIVSICLLGFGVFWTGEGLGYRWPMADGSLLLILAIITGLTLGTVSRLGRVQKTKELEMVA